MGMKKQIENIEGGIHMRITELLKKESIELGVKVADKNAAIDKLISLNGCWWTA